MPIVSCTGLRKSYRRKAFALAGIELRIEPGEVVGLLGPNGAGKTTVTRLLLGLIRPTAGRIEVLGRPPGDPRALARIGALLEEPPFYPWLSGRRNLQILADTGVPVPSGAVEDALRRVRADDFAGRRVSGYSQGMRQRLGLAAALLRRPDLLLLDEPANGLDPEAISWFRELVREVADGGCTVLLCSHLLAEVEQVCDRVIVLLRGRVVAQARDWRRDPRRAGGWRVLVDPSESDRARRALDRFPVRDLGGGALEVREAIGRQVSAALAAAGIAPDALIPEQPGLERWYLDLVAGAATTGTEEHPHALAAS